jgi:hypothetical protein
LLVKTKMYSKKVFDKHSMTQKGVNIQKWQFIISPISSLPYNIAI